MAKPIITLNGLKIVIMLGMLVIILTGVRFALYSGPVCCGDP